MSTAIENIRKERDKPKVKVALNTAEAFQLRRYIESIPANQRTAVERSALDKLLAAGA